MEAILVFCVKTCTRVQRVCFCVKYARKKYNNNNNKKWQNFNLAVLRSKRVICVIYDDG